MKYKLTLTEEQMRVTQKALEEYFRLRMGQAWDFSDEMAQTGIDLSSKNPEHKKLFDRFITKRDALREIMGAFFRVAFPNGYSEGKSEDSMIAECIWDAIRTERGQNNWGSAMQIGKEPLPDIEKIK